MVSTGVTEEMEAAGVKVIKNTSVIMLDNPFIPTTSKESLTILVISFQHKHLFENTKINGSVAKLLAWWESWGPEFNAMPGLVGIQFLYIIL